jgi:hypothetical protein
VNLRSACLRQRIRDRWRGVGGGGGSRSAYCGAASEALEEVGEPHAAEKARVGKAATAAGSSPPAAGPAAPRRSTWTAKK